MEERGSTRKMQARYTSFLMKTNANALHFALHHEKERTVIKVVTSPDPLLNQVCEPCDPIHDKSLKRLSKQMAQVMYKNNGVGLAAPQVGVLKRMIVVDVDWEDDDRDSLVLINPEIVEKRGEPVTDGEGCLSIPGVTVPVTRVPWVRVRYLDLQGDMWEIEGDGLLGRCLQHEIDHLDGKTLFESCDAQDRLAAVSDYELAKRAGARPGDTSI